MSSNIFTGSQIKGKFEKALSSKLLDETNYLESSTPSSSSRSEQIRCDWIHIQIVSKTWRENLDKNDPKASQIDGEGDKAEIQYMQWCFSL